MPMCRDERGYIYIGNCETLSGTDASVQSIQKRAPDAVASRPFFVQIVHPLFLEREFCNRLYIYKR